MKARRLGLAGALAMTIGVAAFADQASEGAYTFPAAGLVGDPAQGLIWQRCSLGQRYQDGRCVGDSESFNWREAQARTEALASPECPWRLPRFHELRGLMQPAGDRDLAIDLSAFPDTPPGWYWNQVSAGGHSQQDCFVDFGGEGRTRCNMAGSFYIRLVMDQDGAAFDCRAP